MSVIKMFLHFPPPQLDLVWMVTGVITFLHSVPVSQHTLSSSPCAS
jgi:hypothetical protein